jgi:hypothetical protein
MANDQKVTEMFPVHCFDVVTRVVNRYWILRERLVISQKFFRASDCLIIRHGNCGEEKVRSVSFRYNRMVSVIRKPIKINLCLI